MSKLKEIQGLTVHPEIIERIRVITINEAIKALADGTRANEHAFFRNVMSSKSGGKWLDDLAWEAAQNVTVQKRLSDFALGLDTDLTTVLTPATGIGAVKKYSVDPKYVAPVV